MPTALTPQQVNLTTGQVGCSLLLALVLAILVTTLYRRFHAGPTCSSAFGLTLLITPVVVTMIMIAIGSNVALSLGLVGALSIIRFRTAIKETRDATYLFLVIAVGLCCGSGAYVLALLGTLFVCAVFAGARLLGRAASGSGDYLLVLRRADDTHGIDDTDGSIHGIDGSIHGIDGSGHGIDGSAHGVGGSTHGIDDTGGNIHGTGGSIHGTGGSIHGIDGGAGGIDGNAKDGDDARRTIHKMVRWHILQAAADLGDGQGCEYTYRVRLARGVTPDALLACVRRLEGLSRSWLIRPDSSLAL